MAVRPVHRADQVDYDRAARIKRCRTVGRPGPAADRHPQHDASTPRLATSGIAVRVWKEMARPLFRPVRVDRFAAFRLTGSVGASEFTNYGVRVLLATSGRRAACHAQIQTPRDRVRLPRIVWYSRTVVTASTIVPMDSTTRVGGTGR